VTVILNVFYSHWALVNITEWKIDPNVWCADYVHFPVFSVILVLHRQVNETVTVSFPVSSGSLH
jgi:hypothetical protein